MRKISLFSILFTLILAISFILSKINLNKKASITLNELGTLIIAYCSWGEADEKVIKAVENGANVIIWFSLDLTSVLDEKKGEYLPFINDRNKDYVKIKNIMDEIKRIRQVKHLLSIGGWNAPHITSLFSKEIWIEKIHDYNEKLEHEFEVRYDGFDWDLEGNDDFKSEYNKFTVTELDLMGEISQGLKRKGYIMSMAPSESYFDIQNNDYSLSLLNAPLWQRDFFYHGKNVYTYIFEKYKFANRNDNLMTFDFISIQLYEGYSRTFNFHENSKSLRDESSIYSYFKNLIINLEKGWMVKFSQEPSLKFDDTLVSLNRTNFVIGLANGWAYNSPKFLYLEENELKNAIKRLKSENLLPRGFMFWDIADEGIIINGSEYYLTKIIRSSLESDEK